MYLKIRQRQLYLTLRDFIPVGHSSGLFASEIPHAGQDNEGGLTACLKYTEKCSDNHEMSKVLDSGVAHQGCTPEHNVDREVLCDRDSLNDPVCGEFNDQDSNVDTGC
jgi:hypothetical protein